MLVVLMAELRNPRRPMSKNELLALLYGDASAKPDNFERLNPNLGDRVLPGEMIVIADPNSLECTARESDLMQIADEVNQQVRELSEEEAQFVVNHYDLLEVMTSSAATGLGVGATMVGQQIKSISATLKELESLYQDTFRRHGTFNNAAFFERRKQLFAKLDFALGKLARKGMSLDDSAKLKRALGLSSKSIVHEWKASGIGEFAYLLFRSLPSKFFSGKAALLGDPDIDLPVSWQAWILLPGFMLCALVSITVVANCTS